MASIVQAGIPVQQNPGLSIERIASGFNAIRNADARTQLARQQMEQQERLAQARMPLMQSQEQLAQQQALLANVKARQALQQQQFLSSIMGTPHAGAVGAPIEEGGQPSLGSTQAQTDVGAHPATLGAPATMPSAAAPAEEAARVSPAVSDQNIFGRPLTPLQVEMGRKMLGLPVAPQQSPEMQAKLAAQQAYYQSRALGPISNAVRIANAPDDQLMSHGLTPQQISGVKDAAVQSIVKSLPANQPIQWSAGRDFINQFNQHLRGDTLNFFKRLKKTGAMGVLKLHGSALFNALGSNKTLHDDYINLYREWALAVSDYRQTLGDRATNAQLDYVNNLLKLGIGHRSMEGILQGINNLLGHTTTQLHSIEEGSALKDVRDLTKLPKPKLFDIKNPIKSHLTEVVSPTGQTYHVPVKYIKRYLRAGFNLKGEY